MAWMYHLNKMIRSPVFGGGVLHLNLLSLQKTAFNRQYKNHLGEWSANKIIFCYIEIMREIEKPGLVMKYVLQIIEKKIKFSKETYGKIVS